MKLLVQHLSSNLFLTDNGQWVKLLNNAKVFDQPLAAIKFCIARSMRDVRLVAESKRPSKTLYFYPFGNDPTIKKTRRELRKLVAAQRLVRTRMRMLQVESESSARRTERRISSCQGRDLIYAAEARR